MERPGYKESPLKRWDQYTDDVICVDEEIQPNGLVELPLATINEQEPQLESDSYLESLLTEDLSDDDDIDAEDADDIA